MPHLGRRRHNNRGLTGPIDHQPTDRHITNRPGRTRIDERGSPTIAAGGDGTTHPTELDDTAHDDTTLCDASIHDSDPGTHAAAENQEAETASPEQEKIAI
jgi:hypothetical protein